MLNKKEIKKDIKQLLMFHDIDEFSNEDYKYLVNNIVEYITNNKVINDKFCKCKEPLPEQKTKTVCCKCNDTLKD